MFAEIFDTDRRGFSFRGGLRRTRYLRPDRARRSRLNAIPPRSLRTTALRRSHNRRPPPAASGVQSRRGEPLGRARSSGGLPEGQMWTITRPPELVASRAGDLTPWSAGGPRPATSRDDAAEEAPGLEMAARRPSPGTLKARRRRLDIGHHDSGTGREDVHPPACPQVSWMAEASGTPMPPITHDPIGPAHQRDDGLTWRPLPTRGRSIHPHGNHLALPLRLVRRRLLRSTARRSTSWPRAQR